MTLTTGTGDKYHVEIREVPTKIVKYSEHEWFHPIKGRYTVKVPYQEDGIEYFVMVYYIHPEPVELLNGTVSTKRPVNFQDGSRYSHVYKSTSREEVAAKARAAIQYDQAQHHPTVIEVTV